MHEHDAPIAPTDRSRLSNPRRFVVALAACVAVGGVATGIAGASSGREPEPRGRVAEGEAPRGQDGAGDTSSTVVATTVEGSDDSSTSSTSSPATTAAPATTAVPATATPDPAPVARSVAVPGVGIVSVAAGPRLVSVEPAPGVTYRVESSAREVHVRFSTPTGHLDVQAENEDGQLRIRVRDRRGDAAATAGSGSSSGSASDDGAGHDVGDDHGGDRSGHDAGDDHRSGGHGGDD